MWSRKERTRAAPTDPFLEVDVGSMLLWSGLAVLYCTVPSDVVVVERCGRSNRGASWASRGVHTTQSGGLQ